ncbi:MAG TPA: M48 family metalloprotease, partial [Verrucomicrobiae bacterium]
IYMARSGYDPRQAVVFWQRFADYNRKQGGNTPAFLRTHPTDDKRIQQLEVWLPDALAQYHPVQ